MEWAVYRFELPRSFRFSPPIGDHAHDDLGATVVIDLSSWFRAKSARQLRGRTSIGKLDEYRSTCMRAPPPPWPSMSPCQVAAVLHFGLGVPRNLREVRSWPGRPNRAVFENARDPIIGKTPK